MNHIALYLEKFKELYSDVNDAKKILQKSILEATGIEFPVEKLKEINGSIKIECDPIERSVMLERKEKLEGVLKKNLKLNKVRVQ